MGINNLKKHIEDINCQNELSFSRCYIKDTMLSGCDILSITAKKAFIDNAYFKNVTFNDKVDFWESTFSAHVSFENCVFKGPANFAGVVFSGNINFRKTTFNDTVTYNNAIFNGEVYFEDTVFNANVDFDGVAFKYNASFRHFRTYGYSKFRKVNFYGKADFLGAMFNSEVNFMNTEFISNACFRGADFIGNASFQNTIFFESAYFRGAIFESEVGFQNTTVKKEILLNQVKFASLSNLDFLHCEKILLDYSVIDKSCSLSSQIGFSNISLYRCMNFGFFTIPFSDNIKSAIYNYRDLQFAPRGLKAEEVAQEFNFLKVNYNQNGEYDYEDKAYVEYRRCLRKTKIPIIRVLE